MNLIGEHTDYNDGLSLPFAIPQGVTVTSERIAGRDVEAVARDLGESDRFPAGRPPPRVPGWRAFVRGTVAELLEAGHAVPPVRLEIAGTVPPGSGLASSAALGVGLCLALLGPAGEEADPVDVARLCSRVENTWVGARTGLLDQLAVLLGRDGCATRLDFRTLEARTVGLDLGGWTLVTADSGERHSNAAPGYNARRAECAEAARRLGLSSLRDATTEDAARLPEPLGRRVRHVTGENLRVDAAVAALERGDLAALGRLLDASHAGLRDCYDASTPAVEATVRRMREGGAAGARMVGGGFGGHVLALLPPGVPRPAGAVAVRPAAGARLLEA